MTTKPLDHDDLGPRVQVVTYNRDSRIAGGLRAMGSYGCWASIAHPMSSYGLPVLIRPLNGEELADWDNAYRPGDILTMVNHGALPDCIDDRIDYAVVIGGDAETQAALAAAGYMTLATAPDDVRREINGTYPWTLAANGALPHREPDRPGDDDAFAGFFDEA